MKAGDIWLAQLGPAVGSEIQKTRPCVVISSEDMNAHLRTVIVAPMTTGSRARALSNRSHLSWPAGPDRAGPDPNP